MYRRPACQMLICGKLETFVTTAFQVQAMKAIGKTTTSPKTPIIKMVNKTAAARGWN